MNHDGQPSKKQKVAHQVEPFAQQLAIEDEKPEIERVNVFKRMGEAHLTEKQQKKKAKQEDFLNSLGQLQLSQ
jgi:hypothetical protein